MLSCGTIISSYGTPSQRQRDGVNAGYIAHTIKLKNLYSFAHPVLALKHQQLSIPYGLPTLLPSMLVLCANQNLIAKAVFMQLYRHPAVAMLSDVHSS